MVEELQLKIMWHYADIQSLRKSVNMCRCTGCSKLHEVLLSVVSLTSNKLFM